MLPLSDRIREVPDGVGSIVCHAAAEALDEPYMTENEAFNWLMEMYPEVCRLATHHPVTHEKNEVQIWRVLEALEEMEWSPEQIAAWLETEGL